MPAKAAKSDTFIVTTRTSKATGYNDVTADQVPPACCSKCWAICIATPAMFCLSTPRSNLKPASVCKLCRFAAFLTAVG